MAYEHLSEDDKIMEAIRFVARGEELPTVLREFLVENNLYEPIVNPQEVHNVSD